MSAALADAVALGDIENVPAYVRSIVTGAARCAGRMAPVNMRDVELEEMSAQGVVLVYELHERWEPEKCESFASFVSTYLPLRLIDWWRREMRQRGLVHYSTLPGRGYTPLQRVPLDAIDAIGCAR